MKKNDFDPPICLSIAKLTVEINFQTIKKKKSEKQTKKNQKNKTQTTAQKAEKNIDGESITNRITKITQQHKCETHK